MFCQFANWMEEGLSVLSSPMSLCTPSRAKMYNGKIINPLHIPTALRALAVKKHAPS